MPTGRQGKRYLQPGIGVVTQSGPRTLRLRDPQQLIVVDKSEMDELTGLLSKPRQQGGRELGDGRIGQMS